jgi:hypothetical protein
MSKIAIDNYRGFDIEFDTDYEQFQCIITDNLSKESHSYSAVKKFIDDYKKENQDFKPFYVIGVPESYRSGERIKVIGIRKDNRFIAEISGKKSQISEYNEKDYMLDKESNKDIIRELDELGVEREKLRKSMSEKSKQLISKLDIKTLKEYKQSLLS